MNPGTWAGWIAVAVGVVVILLPLLPLVYRGRKKDDS